MLMNQVVMMRFNLMKGAYSNLTLTNMAKPNMRSKYVMV